MTLLLDKGKKQILEILYAKKRNERSSYMTNTTTKQRRSSDHNTRHSKTVKKIYVAKNFEIAT